VKFTLSQAALIVIALLAAGCQQDLPSPTVVAATAAESPSATPAAAGPLEIKWEELDIPLTPGENFQPWMLTTAIKALDGHQVKITGYMHEGVHQKDNIREFVLVKHIGCQFGVEGMPQHVVMVELVGTLRTSFTTEPLMVEGTFYVKPFVGRDGRAWSLYRMEVTKIEKGKS
jgi:hypothetical protein